MSIDSDRLELVSRKRWLLANLYSGRIPAEVSDVRGGESA